MPKPNLYQSLHTTVVAENGPAVRGADPHPRDGPGRRGGDRRPLALQGGEARRLAAATRTSSGCASSWSGRRRSRTRATFLATLKIDLYPDEVYAFTPKGDVFSFPRGATPLDFAYRVHTDLGHHCAGARVNGKLVPLRTPLQNGDIVEILANPQRAPSRDWLSFVATSRAKSKIRHWLSTEQKARAVEIGRRLLEKELREYKVGAKKVLDGEGMKKFLADEGLARLDDLYGRLGFGKATVQQVLARVLTAEQLAQPAAKPGRLRAAVSKILPFGATGPIAVKGHGDLLAFLAKCCNPLPGEEIVGYVTRGRGVSVHSVDCPNVRNLLYEPEREIEVEWARQEGGLYHVTLTHRDRGPAGDDRAADRGDRQARVQHPPVRGPDAGEPRAA